VLFCKFEHNCKLTNYSQRLLITVLRSLGQGEHLLQTSVGIPEQHKVVLGHPAAHHLFSDSDLHNSLPHHSQTLFSVPSLRFCPPCCSYLVAFGTCSPDGREGSRYNGPIRPLPIVPTRNAGTYGEVGCIQGYERRHQSVYEGDEGTPIPQTQARRSFV